VSQYTLLIARLMQELTNLDRTVNRAISQLQKARDTQDEDFYDAVALNLQKFYMGVERLSVEIAREIDQYVPSGSNWHKQILQQMSLAHDPIRPAVLSMQTYEMLDVDYRGFRHIATHLYAFELKADRIEALVEHLPRCHESLKQDILTFCQYLGTLAQQTSDSP
jgi:hypothetical protein